MAKVAVLMIEGYEESETLTIVDILRRLGIICDTFYFGDDPFVLGMQGMKIAADKPFGEEVKTYDLLVLPGGRPGGDHLRHHPAVMEMVQYFDSHHKYLAAMCSGTVVLSDAKVITNKKVTGYTGYESKLVGGIFVDEVVVCDQNIITSQGSATPYPFAYKIGEVLGKDTSILKEKMLYHYAGGK